MKIFGIETSCDETAAAVVEDGTKIISSVVASSQTMHAKYGGIIPEKAAREQTKSIIPVIKEALVADIDAIAVTVGPGLIGSLLVGVETAKALAFAWKKPIIPINHLVGHIYANWLSMNHEPVLPAIVLLVSGGHTELILMENHSQFKLLGSTRDDAAGECFDKCARLLDLGYPGGPAIQVAAAAWKSEIRNPKSEIKLPRPMISDKNFDFSFSGLKTAVANELKKNDSLAKESFFINSLAHELQEAIVDVLVEKTIRATEKYKVQSVLLAGGVAANSRLREKMSLAMKQLNNEAMELCIPPVSLCTDNAAYIASAAHFNYHPIPWSKINADPSLDF